MKYNIRLAEMMVDYYILGEDWVMNALVGMQTVQGLGHDVERLTKWVQQKREERQRRQEEKAREERQKAQMAAKKKVT